MDFLNFSFQRFGRQKSVISKDFHLQLSANVARFALKNLISEDFQLQISTKVARFARVII